MDAVINIQVPLSNLEMPVVTFSKVSSSCLVVETAIQKALANDVVSGRIMYFCRVYMVPLERRIKMKAALITT